MRWYPLLNGDPGDPPGPDRSSLMPALLVTVTPAAETATDTAAKAADAAAAAAMPARI